MNDLKMEIHKCMLCHDAPCNEMCDEIKVERIIRALRFDNYLGARFLLGDDKHHFEVCPYGVDVQKIMDGILKEDNLISDIDVDIRADICGIKLENPFLLSSSVVSSSYEMCARAFEMGWAGCVFKTICLMDINESSPRFSSVKNWDNSFLGFKNIEQLSEHSLEENLYIFRKLKKDYPSKVLIASIMGRDEEEWEYLASKVTEAGCDAIELNFSCPNMEVKGTGSDVGQDSDLVLKYTKAVRRGSKLPILAKMTSNITDMRTVARASKEGGADGIVAINTIKSITGVDEKSLIPEPMVSSKSSLGGYSGRAIKPIGLRFISDLSSDKEFNGMHLSATGGVYTWKDAVDYLLLGAGSIQVTTAVMEYGYRVIDDLILGLKIFMEEKNFKSLNDIIGYSKSSVVELDELDRETILFPKFNYDKCIGCGRCYISCRDGGHQAIKFDNRKPILNGSKCVGCHLCKLVCPNGAIECAAKRVNKKVF